MIGQASEGFRKELLSDKRSGERPQLVIAADEATQIDYVIERVLEHGEAGIDLKRQAVLLRASDNSDQLEIELARRGIPFVKYGGRKFLEAAHDTLGGADGPGSAVVSAASGTPLRQSRHASPISTSWSRLPGPMPPGAAFSPS